MPRLVDVESGGDQERASGAIRDRHPDLSAACDRKVKRRAVLITGAEGLRRSRTPKHEFVTGHVDRGHDKTRHAVNNEVANNEVTRRGLSEGMTAEAGGD